MRKNGIRWSWVIGSLVTFTVIAGLWVQNLDDSVHYYVTVSEYFKYQQKYVRKKVKVAGKVKQGSLKHEGDRYEFIVEDAGSELAVTYIGMAPDTFKDGSEVVVDGRGQDGNVFLASSLMAKCASKYSADGAPPLEYMRDKSVH